MKNCSSAFLKVQSSTFFYIFHLSRQILLGSWNDTARLYHLFVRKLKTTWVLNGSKSSMAIIDFFEGDIFSHIFFWEEVQTRTTIRQRSLWSFIGIFKQQIFHKYFQNMVGYLRLNFSSSYLWFSQWFMIKWCCNMV